MKVEYDLRGFNDLMARLIELREDVGKATTYRVASAMARVVRNAARQNAAAVFVDSANIVANIVAARGKQFTPPIVTYEVGVRHGTRKQKHEDNDPFYWWYWEFGHNNHYTKRFERRPFLVPAMANNQNAALAAGEGVVSRAVKRIEAKANNSP